MAFPDLSFDHNFSALYIERSRYVNREPAGVGCFSLRPDGSAPDQPQYFAICVGRTAALALRFTLCLFSIYSMACGHLSLASRMELGFLHQSRDEVSNNHRKSMLSLTHRCLLQEKTRYLVKDQKGKLNYKKDFFCLTAID